MAEVPVVTPEFVSGKKVLLRYDLDVITDGEIDDFRLKAGLPTLKLCLEHASSVVMIGHVGRPGGKEVSELSVAPIYGWLENQGFKKQLESDKLRLLENLRFEKGEEEEDQDFAKDLATFGDVFVNEAFASYRPAASTTVLPTLMPHVAGLHFAKEVERLTQIRENPKKPLVVIMGGAKVEDKRPVIESISRIADTVLVGGKLAAEMNSLQVYVDRHNNVNIGELNEEGIDIAPQTTQSWGDIIKGAKMIVWNGPLGKVEEGKNDQSKVVAQMIIDSNAESIVGGGDTISALNKWGLLDKFSFVSTGGGAMLEFLSNGTLPTIEALA